MHIYLIIPTFFEKSEQNIEQAIGKFDKKKMKNNK